MAVLFLFALTSQAISGVAAIERAWPRRLNSCATTLDFVIGIDASKSMTSEGWEAAKRVANSMIAYMVPAGVQNKGEVLLYYFNGLLVA